MQRKTAVNSAKADEAIPQNYYLTINFNFSPMWEIEISTFFILTFLNIGPAV